METTDQKTIVKRIAKMWAIAKETPEIASYRQIKMLASRS